MKNIMKKLSLCVAAGCILAPSVNVNAGLVVVVHPDNATTLDSRQLRNIYLGKVKTFPDGKAVSPIDLSEDDELREVFVKRMLKKTESSLNAYWARMIFSAKAQPPREIADTEKLLSYVAANKSAIAYLDSKDVDERVRVVFTLDE